MSIPLRPLRRTSSGAFLVALAVSTAACRDDQVESAPSDGLPSTNTAVAQPSLPRFVEVGGKRIRVLTLGLEQRLTGEPVFVLESGAETALEAWAEPFTRSLSTMAPVVAYDRPGVGRSEFDGRDPTPEHVAEHLHSLLDALRVPPPYILVGHSWGGPLILHYAARHPTDVVGLVYLDPSHPNRATPEIPAEVAEQAKGAAWPDSIRSGPAAWPEGRRAGSRVRFDFWMTPPDRRVIPPNPAVPTAVVLGTSVDGTLPLPSRAEAEASQQRRVDEVRTWLRSVAQLDFVVCSTCGHFVHQDNVELTVEAVRRVFNWIP